MTRRGWLVVFCSVLVCTSVGGMYYRYHEQRRLVFKVAFLNVGQGDATLIRFDNGEKMLVDCGPDRKILSELGAVLPVYDRTIDYLLISHFDSDHYGGCLDVLRRYDVKQIISTDATKPHDPYWQSWYDLAYSENAVQSIITSRATWNLGSTKLEFLAPDSRLMLDSAKTSSNNTSIVFRLTHKDIRYLFTGDIEREAEAALVLEYCGTAVPHSTCSVLEAEVLKVAHHGSDTSSNEAFLQAVAPKTAVISVGRNNRFKHPSPRVLKRLDRGAVRVLRTDELGSILMH